MFQKLRFSIRFEIEINSKNSATLNGSTFSLLFTFDISFGTKTEMTKNRTRNTLVAKTARKLQIKLNEEKKGKKEEPKEMPMEEPVEEKKETGLMSRRS